MAGQKSSQLLLGIKLDDDTTFANFYSGRKNSQVLEFLRQFTSAATETFVYLWGNPACGRTHLLQAMCHGADDHGMSSIYIPLQDHLQMRPEILLGLENLALVCLDDIDAVIGNKAWEQALFQLYNYSREAGVRVLVSAQVPAAQLIVNLSDLQSRLQWGLTFRLNELDDDEKQQLLQLRAEYQGMHLDESVAVYIVQRSDRSVTALMDVLARLEKRTLEEKRRVTIPLVKELMGW